jgi:hypothetical protein
MASTPNYGIAMRRSAVSVHLPEGVQPTTPVRIANTKVIVANQRMSPASVPRLAEIVRSVGENIAASL